MSDGQPIGWFGPLLGTRFESIQVPVKAGVAPTCRAGKLAFERMFSIASYTWLNHHVCNEENLLTRQESRTLALKKNRGKNSHNTFDQTDDNDER